MLLFACSEAVESKLLKLETSCTVMLPPTVSFLFSATAKVKFKMTQYYKTSSLFSRGLFHKGFLLVIYSFLGITLQNL